MAADRGSSVLTIDAGSRDIDRQKDALLDEISHRLEQKMECQPLFTLEWECRMSKTTFLPQVAAKLQALDSLFWLQWEVV
jgi:hypothetical protein